MAVADLILITGFEIAGNPLDTQRAATICGDRSLPHTTRKFSCLRILQNDVPALQYCFESSTHAASRWAGPPPYRVRSKQPSDTPKGLFRVVLRAGKRGIERGSKHNRNTRQYVLVCLRSVTTSSFPKMNPTRGTSAAYVFVSVCVYIRKRGGRVCTRDPRIHPVRMV